MDKVAFSQYVPARHGFDTFQQCVDEVQREINVRKRLYDRWLAEGKHTFSEADTRMRALMGALLFLNQFVDPTAKPKLDMAGQPF